MGFVRVAAFSAVGGTLGAAGLVIWRLSALPARSDHCAASCLVGNVAAALVIQRSSRGFVLRSSPFRILRLFLLVTCAHPPSLARLVHPVWPACSPLCAAPLPVPHSAVWRVSPWGALGRLLRGVPCVVRWAPGVGPSRRPVFSSLGGLLSFGGWLGVCLPWLAGVAQLCYVTLRVGTH